VHGGWKAMVRLHRGSSLVGVPVFLPEDRGIPPPEVPASARFTREFRGDRELLQRERKDDVPGALTASAYVTVLLIGLSLLALLAIALLRLEAAGRPRAGRPSRAPGGGLAGLGGRTRRLGREAAPGNREERGRGLLGCRARRIRG
jgi:hypothetical protein